jgi:DNA-binding MarR family transcriptional regulator
MSTLNRDPVENPDNKLILDNYFPYFLGVIANRWTSSSSRLYLSRFGIGIVEWRILASLRALGPATSLDIANLVGSDPAAISRGIRQLERQAHVVPVTGSFRGRTKPYDLTPSGGALYEEVRKVADARETVLLRDLSKEERDNLLGYLRKIHKRLGDL